jgi:hypothetical protein
MMTGSTAPSGSLGSFFSRSSTAMIRLMSGNCSSWESNALKRLGVGFGIDMKGLIKPEEQVHEEQQAQQQQQMMAQAGLAATPNAVNQVGEMVRDRQADGNKTHEKEKGKSTRD